jgi:hypothetical protein
MTFTTPKQRLFRVVLQVSSLFLLLMGYGVYCTVTGDGIPCLIYQATGLQCAGCGLTRAFSAVMRLEFSAAFAYNPIWPLYVCYFSWLGVAGSVIYVRRGEAFRLPGKAWFHIGILSAVSVFGILRNFI